MNNAQALVEGDEECKDKESFQGNGPSMLQVGGKMEGDGEENDGHISGIESGNLGSWEMLQTLLERLAIVQNIIS